MLITYEDAVRRLQQFLGGTDLMRAHEDVKLAVSMAYEGLTSEHDWKYYHSEWGFNTVASVETTVTYTQSTLKAVLATAVSSWAVYGKLLVSNIVGEVDALDQRTFSVQSINVLDERKSHLRKVARLVTATRNEQLRARSNRGRQFDGISLRGLHHGQTTLALATGRRGPWIDDHHRRRGFDAVIERRQKKSLGSSS